MKSFWRFCLVGALGFFVDVGVLYALAPWMDWYTARVFSFLAAATFTWALNRRYTFVATGQAGSGLAREYMKYLGSMTLGAIANYALYVITLQALNHPAAPFAGVALGSVAGLLINYLLARFFVFQKQNPHDR